MTETTDWTHPHEVSDVDMVFGPADVYTLMPTRQEAEDAIGRWPNGDWYKFVDRWFYDGLPEGTQFKMKDGVDQDKALRHLRAVIGSWTPKHEHKTAAVAYLSSLWFEEPPK